MSLKVSSSILFCLLLATGCGDNSKSKVLSGTDTTVSPSTSLSQSTQQVTNEIEELKNLSPGESKSMPFALMATTWWTDPQVGLMDGRTNTYPTISARDYVSIELDPGAVRENGSSISVFGRLNHALAMLCIMGEIIPASSFEGTKLKAGNYQATVSAATAAKVKLVCNEEIETDMELSLKVADTTNTTYYDTKIDVCFGLVTCTGSNIESSFFYRNSSTVTNIVSSEASYADGSPVPTHVSRTVVSLDKVNDKLKAEYLSGFIGTGIPDANGESIHTHRLYKDGNMGVVVGTTDAWNSSSRAIIAYALKGDLEVANSSTSINFSFTSASATPNEGCFNRTTGVLVEEPTCTIDSDIQYTTSSSLTSDLYGGYDSDNYEGSETSAFSFTDESDAISAEMSRN